MMLGLGIVLLFRPDWLSDIRVAAVILGAALIITVCVGVVTKAHRST
jgi:hypothetical protein